MPKRALVTGADGFVGRHLTEHLRAGGWDVAEAGGPQSGGYDLAEPAAASAMVADFQPFDVVFHLAAISFVPQANQDPHRAMAVNFCGLVNLLASVRSLIPQPRVVFTSTSEIYGAPNVLPVDESHPLNPPNAYAITKAAADAYARFAFKEYGQDLVVARPFNHSGPGQSDQFALPSFARQIAEAEADMREPVMHVGNLSARRDFSHVADVVEAYERMADRAQAGEAYNVCSGRAVSLKDALDLMLQQARVSITVKVDPKRVRNVDEPEIRGSADKLRSATGWRPTKSFEAIVKELLAFWRERIQRD